MKGENRHTLYSNREIVLRIINDEESRLNEVNEIVSLVLFNL